jgi:hypothetical protein
VYILTFLLKYVLQHHFVWRLAVALIIGLLVLVFALTRVALISLALASFRSAPARIYDKVKWTSYLGHIGS